MYVNRNAEVRQFGDTGGKLVIVVSYVGDTKCSEVYFSLICFRNYSDSSDDVLQQASHMYTLVSSLIS